MRDLAKYRDEYLANMGFEATLVKYRRKLVIEQMLHFSAGRVLEVGCGVSSLAEDFQEFQEFTVIDPIEKFISLARESYFSAPARKKINFQVHSLQNFASQAGKTFDFIIVSSLIHELEDKASFFGSLRNLCGPETVVHFNVPNSHSIHNLLALKMGLIKDPFDLSETARSFQRKSTYSLQTLSDELMANEFRVLQSGSYFLKPFANFQMEYLKNLPDFFPPLLFEALYEASKDLPGLGAEIFANARRVR